MKRNFPIELLAPAKDKQCAFTAINYGADAIYIGASNFGARKNAANNLEDIKEIIDYAHKFNVKVFITINTILFDNELKPAQELINKLYEYKADAIIIQDMGLLELDLPPIALHSSTQCHNSTLEKVKFLEKVGFERAILARELSLDEIKEIGKNTNIELETFIQGALCVSYSGQCYLSYAIGGRSANRGECAQPCRKKYSLVDKNDKVIAKNQHLLCLKDFNASDYLEELIDAGVSSFKIEGRLKDENYIKNTVSFYRQKLDEIIAKKGLKRASLGTSAKDLEPNLYKTFNRDFCSYFLNGRDKNITSFLTPKNRGEFIGTITEIKKHSFSVGGKLNKNDGISFFDENSELCGFKIEKVENNWYFPNSMDKIKKGLKIYRNFDYEFNKKLENSNITRKIAIDLDIKITDKTIEVLIKDELNNSHLLTIKNDFEPAQNIEKASQNIEKQFSKLGSTEFILNNFTLNGEKIPFIKINELNEIRRQLIDEFVKIREYNYETQKQKHIKYSPYFLTELDYKSNINNEKAKEFYEKCGATCLEYGLEHNSNKSFQNKQLMETKHCLKYSLGFCSRNKSTLKVNEPLFLVDEKGQKYQLEFDCKNCKMKIFSNCTKK